MSSEQENQEYAPVSEYSNDDIQHRAEDVTKELLDKSQQAVSSIQDTARDIFHHPRGYAQKSTEYAQKSAKYAWYNFPPISWFGYEVAAFNAIPLIIFIGWILGTLALVLFLGGAGVLLAEGFFLGIGLIFLLPVLAILTFSAISTAFFTIFGWSLYKIGRNILHYVGLAGREVQFDANHIAKGVERGYDQKTRKEY